MAHLRMVQVEVEATPEVAAEIIRLALGGEQPADPPAAAPDPPADPGPASFGAAVAITREPESDIELPRPRRKQAKRAAPVKRTAARTPPGPASFGAAVAITREPESDIELPRPRRKKAKRVTPPKRTAAPRRTPRKAAPDDSGGSYVGVKRDAALFPGGGVKWGNQRPSTTR